MTEERKLQLMESRAKNINSKLEVIWEESTAGSYLILEHEEYGHVTELHPDDYEVYEQLIRDGLEAAINAVPW